MNKLFIILALIGFCFALFFFYISTYKASPPSYKDKPFNNPYDHVISATGLVEASGDNIDIGTPSDGLVTDVYVKVGDEVYKQQPLIQLDTRKLRAELLVKQADVRVAEGNLVKVQDQLKRLRSVKDMSSISKDTLGNRENDVAIAESQLTLAKAQMNEIETQIARLTIRAPKSGVILQCNIHKGEYASTTPKSPLIILGDITQLQVRVDIDEEQAGRFNPKEKAIAYPRNNTTVSFPLHFERIEPHIIPKKQFTGSGREKIDTRVLQVIYRFEPPKDFPIYVGQLLDVLIQVQNEPQKDP